MRTIILTAIAALMLLPITLTTQPKVVQQPKHDETITELVMTIADKYKKDPSTVLQIVEAADNASKEFAVGRKRRSLCHVLAKLGREAGNDNAGNASGQ